MICVIDVGVGIDKTLGHQKMQVKINIKCLIKKKTSSTVVAVL